MTDSSALILVVDDNEMNRDMLARRLERQGYRAMMVEDGEQALAALPQHPFDLILLDIMMPRLNGYDVLQQIKADAATRHIPVIMISAVDDLDSVVKCVEMGADDYLFKPFNPILLKARVSASLEKKRLRDQERLFLQGAGRVAAHPATATEATILMAALIGLDAATPDLSPAVSVDILNQIYEEFDRLTEAQGLHRVKSLGATYLAAGNLLAANPQHTLAAIETALAMPPIVAGVRLHDGRRLGLRVAVADGMTVSGMIQNQVDVWGEAVSSAQMIQLADSEEGVFTTAAIGAGLPAGYHFEVRPAIQMRAGVLNVGRVWAL